MANVTPPCTIAIFGAVGDLTKKLLMPAVYDLAASGLLDAQTHLLGLDHNDCGQDGWCNEMSDALHAFATKQFDPSKVRSGDDEAYSFVMSRLEYVHFDFESDEDFQALSKRLESTGIVLFYLAVAPRFFETIVEKLSHAGALVENDQRFRRVIIEKPFGTSIDSARKLNEQLRSVAAESQLYRIDHFLGKEAVQGIPALRFGNGLFEPFFNRDAVSSVQITAAETVGVAERGSFYEGTGALRDMIPNHLFSLLTQVAMERPRSFEGDVVRDAKATLLSAIPPILPADAARGQYAAGTVEGQPVPAYRDEHNVARDSRTETYAALTVRIDNSRWRDVPFYLRTGKRMGAHVTTIALPLRNPPDPFEADPVAPNLLLLGIDPQRGMVQRFSAKRPGVDLALGPAEMGFRYETTFDEPPNVGYETLLYHALVGEGLLFQRSDMIEFEWAAVQPVLDAWEKSPETPELYAAGSEGPPTGDELLSRNGDKWLPVAPLDTLGT